MSRSILDVTILECDDANVEELHTEGGPLQAQSAVPDPEIVSDLDQAGLFTGDPRNAAPRVYTSLKVLGHGGSSTVWLCNWQSPLPPGTLLPAMQCSVAVQSKYPGKRLVAIKSLREQVHGGALKELQLLRAIPAHPNIIPLYDFFVDSQTEKPCLVFEPMEGNMYQLIKTRRGRPFAAGLVASIFKQIVSGLHHIHTSGYFHRDMMPENLLVTTTGICNYRTLVPGAPSDASPERDVVAVVKIADFGGAAEIHGRVPFTEYVAVRWYRAPELILRQRNYSSPIDMWALGTITAELLILRPLFPGSSEIDQVTRICDLLGDPVVDYGRDEHGRPLGGGRWPASTRLAHALGFDFPRTPPKDIRGLFDPSTPPRLVECIANLLRYDPEQRLTSQECLEHPYLADAIPMSDPSSQPLAVAPLL